ncbi:MAG: serine hydrolase domain-containing protein, partial [Halioglobus sp.]
KLPRADKLPEDWMDRGIGMEQQLQALLDQAVGPSPGAMLAVHAPLLGLDWSGAAGMSSLERGTTLTTQHSFRVASMSKTFTGVLVAQLLEREELSLSDPITAYLPEELLVQIPVAHGHDVGELTIEQLLQHRAGFNDFATSQEWAMEIAKDPGRPRTPMEIISWALAHTEIVGAPGETYRYSDTGYVLLGILLEKLTDTPYWQLCRERVFDPLGMGDTWLEGYEEPRNQLSHPYVVMDGQYIDALQIHGSVDWAGGGHVSTLEDIKRFLRGVFNCRLFTYIDTLDQFLDGPEASAQYFYGMGVGRKQILGKHLWGHLGHWGSFMCYCPEQRLSLCGTLNYDQAAQNDFIAEVLKVVFPDSCHA